MVCVIITSHGRLCLPSYNSVYFKILSSLLQGHTLLPSQILISSKCPVRPCFWTLVVPRSASRKKSVVESNEMKKTF